MNKLLATVRLRLTLALFLCIPCGAYSDVNHQVQQLMEELRSEAARPFTAQAGLELWQRESDGRSCASCHTADPDVEGRHEKTGKLIEPMSPSVNPDRLTEIKKINKWLLRNCKWTFGRECTAQEKGDVLLWLTQQ